MFSRRNEGIMSAAMSSETPTTDRITRPLTADDAPAFAELYAHDPVRYLPVWLNLEREGWQSPQVRCWGAFDAADSRVLRGILIRFGNTLMAVDADGSCGAVFARIADSQSGLAGVRGTSETVWAMTSAVQSYAPANVEESRYLRLMQPPQCAPERLGKARRATLSDLNALAALYASAGDMYRSRSNVESKLRNERVFVAEEPASILRPARIVSCALINVEGSDAGVIGGVFTLPEVRGKGYAGACTAALSLDLQRDGKTPYLFYENPIAGMVYRHMGYEEVGSWMVLYLSARRRLI